MVPGLLFCPDTPGPQSISVHSFLFFSTFSLFTVLKNQAPLSAFSVTLEPS